MKAKEYAWMFINEMENAKGKVMTHDAARKVIYTALQTISNAYIDELRQMAVDRGIKSDAALFSCIKEQHIKWRAMARRLETHYKYKIVREDGFKIIAEKVYSDIFKDIPSMVWK